MRFLFPFLGLFLFFFITFWNVKSWTLSATKKIGLIALCSLLSAACVAAFVFASNNI